MSSTPHVFTFTGAQIAAGLNDEVQKMTASRLNIEKDFLKLRQKVKEDLQADLKRSWESEDYIIADNIDPDDRARLKIMKRQIEEYSTKITTFRNKAYVYNTNPDDFFELDEYDVLKYRPKVTNWQLAGTGGNEGSS